MIKPNFLMIGAAKSGSTSLYYYLRQHPEIFLPSLKEPHFFGHAANYQRKANGPGDREVRIVTEESEYHTLFAEAGAYPARGEMSQSYLKNSLASQRIHAYNPQMKLFAILRQPADAAFSFFLMLRREKRETLTDFAQAVAAEPERKRQGWDAGWQYSTRGFYYQYLQKYFALFPREQMRVYLYEDFSANPLAVCQDLFRFLGVDDTFKPDFRRRHNMGLLPRNENLGHILQVESPLKMGLARTAPVTARVLSPVAAPMRWAFNNFLTPHQRRAVYTWLRERNKHKPTFDRRLRRKLTAYYREDILQLQDLIGRDLSHWLKD